MAEATIHQTTVEKKVSRWTLIKEMFAEMDRLRAQMKQDRVEIKRLGDQTRANLAEIKIILDRIEAS